MHGWQYGRTQQHRRNSSQIPASCLQDVLFRQLQAMAMIGGRAKTRNRIVVVTCLASLVLVPSPALAQDQAGIVGSVQDETGSFLPGVIVEARSPVLIEQVRSTSTDAAGHYQFVGLPAGTYTVTLRLSAFRTLVREDCGISDLAGHIV